MSKDIEEILANPKNLSLVNAVLGLSICPHCNKPVEFGQPFIEVLSEYATNKMHCYRLHFECATGRPTF